MTRFSTSARKSSLALSSGSALVALLMILGGCEDTARTTGTSVLSSMPDVVGIRFNEARERFDGTPFEHQILYEDLLEDRTVFREKNWIVVTQEPEVGSTLTSDTEPCLGIVKESEEPSLSEHQRSLTCSKHTSLWERLEKEEKSSQSTTQTAVAIELTPLERHLLALGMETTKRHPHIYYKLATGVDDVCDDRPCWKFAIVVTRGTCPNSMFLQMVYWNEKRQFVDYARSDDVFPFTGLPVTVTVYDKHYGDDSLKAGVHLIHCS